MKKINNNEDLKNAIKKIAFERLITLSQMKEVTGIDTSNLCKIMLGKKHMTLKVAMKLMEMMGLSLYLADDRIPAPGPHR